MVKLPFFNTSLDVIILYTKKGRMIIYKYVIELLNIESNPFKYKSNKKLEIKTINIEINKKLFD